MGFLLQIIYLNEYVLKLFTLWVYFFTTMRLPEGRVPRKGDTWQTKDAPSVQARRVALGTQSRPAGPWSPPLPSHSFPPSHSQWFLFHLKFISFRRLDKFNNLYLEEKKIKI